MPLLPILELPHPVLRQRARKIRKIDSSVLQLANDMVETMRDAPGIGLAANQVGVLKRLIVVQLLDEEEARIYINPEILHREGEREVEEGCLSIPGYKGFVNRSVWVKFTALDASSKVVKLKAEDMLSQVLEHEVDHLNGILYIDHLESHEKLIPVTQEPEPEADDAEGVAESTAKSTGGLPTSVDGSVEAADAGSDPRETPASMKVR